MEILLLEQYVGQVVGIGLLAVKLFAFVNSLLYKPEAYEAAGKLNKPTWSILLGVGAVLQLLGGGLGILNIVFTVAAFVYLADVRPALSGLKRR